MQVLFDAIYVVFWYVCLIVNLESNMFLKEIHLLSDFIYSNWELLVRNEKLQINCVFNCF